jgi:hypothetical protein
MLESNAQLEQQTPPDQRCLCTRHHCASPLPQQLPPAAAPPHISAQQPLYHRLLCPTRQYHTVHSAQTLLSPAVMQSRQRHTAPSQQPRFHKLSRTKHRHGVHSAQPCCHRLSCMRTKSGVQAALDWPPELPKQLELGAGAPQLHRSMLPISRAVTCCHACAPNLACSLRSSGSLS